jgi:diguanylate cyclase (GGDEF)-like protein
MDPRSVILVMALNLLFTGGLFLLIARQMPPRQGVDAFGAGAAVFGAAYLARLILGLSTGGPVALLSDLCMVGAALLFLSGLDQFVGRPALRLRTGLLVAGSFVLVHLAVVAIWQEQGRHSLLNTSLGLLYGTLALGAWRALPEALPSLHAPLRSMAALMGLLGTTSIARGVHTALTGTSQLYSGPIAQGYYAMAVVAASLIGPVLLWMVFLKLNLQLADLASHDPLTRVLNRHGMREALRRHFGARSGQTLVALVVDLDHFKRINDSHGHTAGDQVLRAAATELVRQLRGGDFVARTGGEEFIIGCTDADAATALALAERLRRGLEALATPVRGSAQPLRFTASIGVSQPFATLDGWEDAVRAADGALYAAKEGGRNRVVQAASAATAP